MLDDNNLVIWEPNELIYEAGSLPKEAYLIMDGSVDIETKDGLKLNTLTSGEIFGETSILLRIPRTVTVRACSGRVIAKRIPKSYFTKIKSSDLILNAIIRKTQIRLMDSNKQSNKLANQMDQLLNEVSSKTPPKINELAKRIKKIKENINKIQLSSQN